MDITVSHDNDLDLWTLTYVGVHLKEMRDVVDWRNKLMAAADKFGGKRVDILIDFTGFELEASMVPLYARITKEFADKHVRCVIRYGAISPKTAASLSAASKTVGYPLRVERDRDIALTAMQRIRGERTRGSRPSIPDK